MSVLDRAFPPRQCVFEEEAERYVRTGTVYETVNIPYYPVFGFDLSGLVAPGSR